MKQKVTMNDVAKIAGVSQATVSFVLNNAPISISQSVRDRVMAAVKETGFVPRKKAKNYANDQQSAIALFIPNSSNFYYMELEKNITHFAEAKGYHIIVINTNRSQSDEMYYLRFLTSHNSMVAGIIYGFTPSNAAIERMAESEIPFVVVGEMNQNPQVDLVTLDSVQSGSIVAQHLLDLGHTELAFITSPTNSITLSRKRRLNGIQEAISGKGSVTVLCSGSETEAKYANYELQIGYELTKGYFQGRAAHATAFIGANDMIAFGIFKALHELKIRIPDEVSVCGFDNILFADLTTPSLTTVDLCTHWRCGVAIDILHNKIQNLYLTPSIVNCSPVLIQRDSTGPVRKR